MLHPPLVLTQATSLQPRLAQITTIFAKLFNRILTEEIENVTGSPFGQVGKNGKKKTQEQNSTSLPFASMSSS